MAYINSRLNIQQGWIFTHVLGEGEDLYVERIDNVEDEDFIESYEVDYPITQLCGDITAKILAMKQGVRFEHEGDYSDFDKLDLQSEEFFKVKTNVE